MKTAIVTGTRHGVGRKTVNDLVDNGYKVIATSRNINNIKDLESESIIIEELDLTKFEQIKGFYEKYKDITIDLIVNNAAGGVEPTTLVNSNPENFTLAYSLNVSGPMYLNRLFVKNLQKAENPTIIFISSFAGRYPYVGQASYCNSKRAVGNLSELFRLEYSGYGIKVTEICPASINTHKEQIKPIALEAEDISSAILWVSSMHKRANINYLEIAPTYSKIFN